MLWVCDHYHDICYSCNAGIDYRRQNMSNIHPLEVVGRGSETQLQVGEKLDYLIQR